MRRLDRARLSLSGVMMVLGAIIIVRTLIRLTEGVKSSGVAGAILITALVGALLVLYGAYRIRQYLQYRSQHLQ